MFKSKFYLFQRHLLCDIEDKKLSNCLYDFIRGYDLLIKVKQELNLNTSTHTSLILNAISAQLKQF